MAKVPACAKAFVGRWRIAEMDVWDNDFLDLVEEAHLTLKGTADGEIVFGALKGFFDVRYGAATARPAQSSRGKATMRTIQHAVVDGLSLAPQDAWSATSTSTTATIQASYASAPDFFNSLLVAYFESTSGWSGAMPRVLPLYPRRRDFSVAMPRDLGVARQVGLNWLGKPVARGG